MRIEEQIKRFFDTERNSYNTSFKNDNEHLLPITRQRFEEKFSDKLSEIDIERYFEDFENSLI
jgi:hypothetical protein